MSLLPKPFLTFGIGVEVVVGGVRRREEVIVVEDVRRAREAG